MCNGPMGFKVGIQGLMAQSMTVAELVAATPAMKEAIYGASMTGEVGLDK